MGLADRNYSQAIEPPSRFAGAQVTKYLLIINITIYVIDYFILGVGPNGRPPLQSLGAFVASPEVISQPWRLFTYQFLHGPPFHLLANMMGLFFFGPLVERWWGSKPFLALYLICGCIGAVVYSILALLGILGPVGGILIGASGSLFGILIAAARIAPDTRVMIFPLPVPIKLRTMVIVFLSLATLNVALQLQNNGGEACHLGGAIGGFLLTQFPEFLNRLRPNYSSDRRTTASRKPSFSRRQSTPKLRPRPNPPASDAEVDAILDKVSSKGLQSLSEREREILRRASRR